jgi:predicted HD phosphohydrolase
LEFQGGIMNQEEVAEFEKNEYYREAVELRRWDDMAKDANLVTPLLDSFIYSIEASVK